jgi:hypothetical protein
MEFAEVVRHSFKMLSPDAIAVELPDTLKAYIEAGVKRLPAVSVIAYQTRNGNAIYLPIEPTDPMCEAIRCGLTTNIPVFYIDPDIDEYPQYREPVPDTYAVHRVGVKAYYDTFCRVVRPMKRIEDKRRELGMAYQLQQLAKNYKKILFICGMAHLSDVRTAFNTPQAVPLGKVRRFGVRLFHLHPEALPEVLSEYPFLSAVYEYRRTGLPQVPDDQHSYILRKKYGIFELLSGGKDHISEEEVLDVSIRRTASKIHMEPLDRQKVFYHLFREAGRHYHQETSESVSRWQKRTFFRFCRNYALSEGLLLPQFYHLVTSARGCIDDNFSYALWRLGSFYPWQRENADLSTISIKGEDLWLGTKKIRIRRRIPRIKRRPVPVPKKMRRREQRPGDWLKGFSDPNICSYPVEDIMIENFGKFLKTKGGLLLSEEHTKSHPFETTILDGIDIRETVRHMYEGRIYVKEFSHIKGGVGSVVVIYDEDEKNKNFPYTMTWLGEHAQESDMAFYATNPWDHVVGPGICRCTYGGFLLSYPPLRMLDIWADPDYDFARSKSETLLLAALDYSLEKYVVYVATTPPRSFIKQVAARWGKQIVYIPIGQLSPVKLKKLRVFHILMGKDKREIAHDYIW